MVSKALFSSVRGDWTTPRSLFDALDAEFHFTLDAAASADNALCRQFYDVATNGLAQDWGREVVWLNPPYGSDMLRWAAKARAAADAGATVVMLVPARTDTRWFHRHVYHRAELRFLPGRIRFGGSVCGAPFPSMLCIFYPKETP